MSFFDVISIPQRMDSFFIFLGINQFSLTAAFC